MERRSLFDSIPMAIKDCRENWHVLLVIGALYAGMNFTMQLPALMLDVDGTFDSMFQGDVPIGLGGMSSEQKIATTVQSAIFLMSTTVNAILWFGAIQLGLGLVDGRSVDVWDGICAIERVPFAIGWGLLSVVYLPAYMCCFLPGLALSSAFWHWPTFAIDRKCGAGDSLGPSMGLFRDNAFAFIMFSLLMVLISVVGALFYFLASVITFPFAIMLTVRVYRTLVPSVQEE